MCFFAGDNLRPSCKAAVTFAKLSRSFRLEPGETPCSNLNETWETPGSRRERNLIAILQPTSDGLHLVAMVLSSFPLMKFENFKANCPKYIDITFACPQESENVPVQRRGASVHPSLPHAFFQFYFCTSLSPTGRVCERWEETYNQALVKKGLGPAKRRH